MPPPSEDDEQAGYRKLIETAFLPLIAKRKPASGGLAVLFDKNYMEASGYAAAIADLTGEHVLLTPFTDGAADPPARFTDGLLEVRDPQGEWHPIRAAFRYVTQKPWNRIPIRTRTRILNPVVTCLSGGRNKLVAMKAYDIYNAELEASGLQIRTPQTIGDVSKQEVPLWVQRFGGQAVVKIPYSNAGQGVFTIVNEAELDRFMETEHTYDRYVVQSLIGNYVWSSVERAGRFYHVGTIPDRHGHIYVADLRMMVCGGAKGFRPLAVYARRSRQPLPTELRDGESSWEVLGTNLSERQPDGSWAASTDRLLSDGPSRFQHGRHRCGRPHRGLHPNGSIGGCHRQDDRQAAHPERRPSPRPFSLAGRRRRAARGDQGGRTGRQTVVTEAARS